MKSFIILLTMGLSSISFANEDALYFGPIQTCTLTSDTNFVLSSIELSVYTAGLFGPSETVQVVYKYPVLEEEGAPSLSFISLLSTDDVNLGTYKGKFTNVNYLVDVVYDLNKQTLTMFDNETYTYAGTCVDLN